MYLVLIFLSWYIQKFEVKLDLLPENAVWVEEVITVDFQNEWRHGIYRTIPTKFRRMDVSLKVLEVENLDKQGTPYRLERGFEDLNIRVGDPNSYVTGVQRYRIVYIAKNVVFDSLSKGYFIWNLTGNGWGVPIKEVSADVGMGGDFMPTSVASFSGYYGGKEQSVEIKVDSLNRRIYLKGKRSLEPYEGVTILLEFPKGTFRMPSFWQKISSYLRLFIVLTIPIVSFLLLFFGWRRKGRDPFVGSVVVQYEPPEDLSPAEAGVIFDEKVDPRDITSEILYLALNGYVKLEETKDRKEYVLHKLKECDEFLKPHQCIILKSLFKPAYSKDGKTTKISDLKNKFYVELKEITSELYENLTKRRYFSENPEKVKAHYMGLGIAVLFGQLIISDFFFFGRDPIQFVISFLSAILTVVVFSIFSNLMVAKTLKGAEALKKVRGLREFISRVEKDRLKRFAIDNPEMFMKLLPYAIAFGEEEKWGKVFEDIYNEIRDKVVVSYVSVSHFRPALTYLSSSAFSVPHSSGGGGSGGFSGGGAGGGGGGAW